MTGKVQDMAPCLNKRVEPDNCFSLMFFLDVLFNFLSFICVTVILQIFGVVLFSVFSVVNGFTEFKKTPKREKYIE